ncbi:MAG: hypothetical protein HY556_06335 [Euryarchaeota archaeon]|nr:hypothetical protein [Euryarchaeota archaeon]
MAVSLVEKALPVKVRRIGSSLGVILPKAELDARNIHEGDEIRVVIKRRDLSELRGLFKGGPPFVREKEDRVDRY